MAKVKAKKDLFDKSSKNQILTSGKEYPVVSQSIGKFAINDDQGELAWFPKIVNENAPENLFY